ncbi:uncharacterized protein RCC_04176 [Ramularia collo-cygni]|uniref:PRISE-like Rossmann-fold domain-containing protein n=1 Tax=Ramularia collo-cygni TaxID=112498 RepID=A0A2D3UPC8_9PEZI|nr:uncharacterized protein RCC_04176 [Ramularia collo-cygni]CZT18332.1 uncharacterized protein RCC_04176 [Ramularia collo-cygni]
MASSNHALVIGASGLIGWAVVEQLLQHPAFGHVTALVNRPLSIQDSFWPSHATGYPTLSLVSGVNLLCSDAEFLSLLQEKVTNGDTISHVFYFAFKEDPNDETEARLNVSMMRRVVRGVNSISSKLQAFVYPGGTRGYGIYLPGGIFSAPLSEEMADNLPESYKKTVAYPYYRALLTEESQNSSWTWCELCPDAIIGFTPNGSGFSLAGHWAVYLYAYKLVYGEGANVPFPGVAAGYDSLYTETSAKTLAKVAIFASLHPEDFRERIFNVADNAQPGSMRERWPQIASWFGLKGVPPPENASASDMKPSEFIKQHREKLDAQGVKGVEIWNSKQLDSYGYWLTFDRHLCLDRLRAAGFHEESRPEEGWWETFEMFKKAGMIR